MTRPADIDMWPTPFDPAVELDWGDPVISRRLLREHLDQDHDSASRRITEVNRHLRRLRQLLPRPPARVLDAACGPGLYAVPLAQMGYDVTAIDVGPAVLAHGRREARRLAVDDRCQFLLGDLRRLTLEPEFEAVIVIYHVIEAFPRSEQHLILRRLARALVPGGLMLVELRTRADQPDGRMSSWDLVDQSLLSDRPHLLLSDSVYDARLNTFVLRETAVFDDGTTASQQTSAALTPLRRMESLFSRGGLEYVRAFDGWSREHAVASTGEVLVVARAPR